MDDQVARSALVMELGEHTPEPAWPPTREQAIAMLVALDVAKFGEDDRDTSLQFRTRLCHALALNALAYYDLDNVDERLAAEARRVLRAQDRATGKK